MKQGWEIKKLGEVVKKLFAGGDKPKLFAEYQTEQLSIPVYANGISLDGLVGYTDKAIVEEESITISARGTIGFCCVRKSPFVPIVRLITLIPSEDIKTEYLCYVLRNTKFDNNGVAIPQLTIPMIREMLIPIPPREEQERIVEELVCLSGVIEKKREQLKELDALAESIFYTMFGNPITNEKGWEVKKLEELCDIINGFAFPSSDFAECNPIKVIKITNVGVNEFISDDSSLPEDYNNMEGCKVHTGDIVIALTRTIISTGVKRAIVPNEYNESLVNQRVAAILAKDRIVSRRFIYSFLGTDFVRQYILQKATALMQPNLSIRDLRDMPTIYPPLALQQEFASKIEAIEKQKELIKQSITETETLFNARMDYYFN